MTLHTAQDRIGKYMNTSSKTARGSPKISIRPTSLSTMRWQTFDQEVEETERWMESPRFARIRRLYSARQVVEQRGTIAQDYSVAQDGQSKACTLGCENCFSNQQAITTFGPYSPGQAVVMKRVGIEGIYLGRLGHFRQGIDQ